MRNTFTSMMVLLLAGCSTIPSPTETLPPGNFQVRLTEASGVVERSGDFLLPVGGSVSGKSCIMTAMGAPSQEFSQLFRKAKLKQGECELELESDAAEPSDSETVP